MVAAIAPYIDSNISKTVNVATSYPFADFEGLYLYGWTQGLKGVATFRPSASGRSVLREATRMQESTPQQSAAGAQDTREDRKEADTVTCPTCHRVPPKR